MEKRTRWSIRKAESSGVVVENGGLEAFYELFKASNPNPAPINYFQSVVESLAPKGMAQIFLAKIGPRYVSGALLLMFGRTVFYKWGASNHQTNRLGAGELLHWRIMQWAKQSGYTRYDLHGAVIGEPVGATLFKRGFGGTPTMYLGEYRKAYSRLLGFNTLSLLRKMVKLKMLASP
jgi:lipid II:glycine glycyltransferase (peptidoglycan interpeptide bridge formation enzyme)